MKAKGTNSNQKMSPIFYKERSIVGKPGWPFPRRASEHPEVAPSKYGPEHNWCLILELCSGAGLCASSQEMDVYGIRKATVLTLDLFFGLVTLLMALNEYLIRTRV